MRREYLHSICAIACILCLAINPALAAVCTPGSLDLELVLTTGTGASSHPIAKCYNSLTVSVLSDCTLTLAANGQNNFVQALWSAAPTYDQVNECPTGGSLDFADQAAATSNTALAALLSTSIYAEGMTATVSVVSGVLTVSVNDISLKYRSSGQSGSTTGIFGTVGAPTCAVATECASAASGCEAGRYPVLIGGTAAYICPLCASGTYSAAGSTACTKCSGGSALPAVGSSANSCVACLAGSFATPGSSDCRPCSPGMFQDSGGQSSCKSCPNKWFSHTYGATQCVKCTNGRPAVCSSSCSNTPGSGATFTATMSTSSLNAAAGWPSSYAYPPILNVCSSASTLVSFTVDETCSMAVHALAVTTFFGGLMCSDPSNTDVDLTLYYVDTTTIMSRFSDDVAPSGKGSIVKVVPKTTDTVTMTVIAATSSYLTPAGTISGDLVVNGGTLVGTTVSSSCVAGTLTSGSGLTLSCDVCEAGEACPTPTASATTCSPGTFSVMGQGSCTSCPANTYTPEAGSSECAACSGTVGNSGSTCEGSTTDCGDGKQFNPETNICDCAPGYRASAVGVCTICPVNTYSNGGVTSVVVATCSACAADTFSAPGSESCSVCPAGEAKNINGECARCDSGQQPAAGGLSCQACASGYYNDGTFDTCQKCNAGYGSTASTCTICTAGSYGNGVTCTNCGLGQYSAEGAKKCVFCPGGSGPNAGRTACTKCAAGTYREAFAVASCEACGAGTVSKVGADVCTPCLAGTFKDGVVCSPCPINTFSSDSGTTTCTACQPGFTTSGETGAVECGGCFQGSYFDSTAGACLECSAGYYQDRAGQRTCKKCPIGKFSDVTGAESCDSCPAGKYQSVSGSSTCRTCPGGTFSSAGKGSCSICAKGKYSSPGAGACSSCTAGYYANKLGSRACTACPVGSKCPGVAVTSPTLCAAGSFQSKPAQTTCTPCAKKSYAPRAGAAKCLACSTATRPGATTCSSRRRMLLTRRGADSFNQFK